MFCTALIHVPGKSWASPRGRALEYLNDTLPPAGANLQLFEPTTCVLADHLAPEDLCCVVFRHLTNFPAPWQSREHGLRENSASTLAPVLLEDEELVHPVALR